MRNAKIPGIFAPQFISSLPSLAGFVVDHFRTLGRIKAHHRQGPASFARQARLEALARGHTTQFVLAPAMMQTDRKATESAPPRPPSQPWLGFQPTTEAVCRRKYLPGVTLIRVLQKTAEGKQCYEYRIHKSSPPPGGTSGSDAEHVICGGVGPLRCTVQGAAGRTSGLESGETKHATPPHSHTGFFTCKRAFVGDRSITRKEIGPVLSVIE